MKLPFLLIFTLLISQSTFSQTDTLNRLDGNNKKTGWWVVYLDKHLAITKDISKAVYLKYSFFQGKFDYFNMGKIGTKKHPVIQPASNLTGKNIEALDGEYRVNYNNRQPRFILKAHNGKLIEYKEFYKDGNLKTRFDYTESCGDTPLHYCIYIYNKDGSLKTKTTIWIPKS